MKCLKCDFIFRSHSDRCPLCGDLDDRRRRVGLLNKRFFIGGKFEVTFAQIYAILALNIVAVCVFVNLLFMPEFLWFLFVLAGVFTGYIIIKIASRVQMLYKFLRRWLVFICPFAILIQHILFSGAWAYDFIIPITVLVSSATLPIFVVLQKVKVFKLYPTVLLNQALILIPFIRFLIGYPSADMPLMWIAFALASAITLNATLFGILLVGIKIHKVMRHQK